MSQDTGSSVGRFSAVEQIQGLSRNTMEKLSGKDTEESPCEIKWLEDVASIISALSNKLPLKLVQELQVELWSHQDNSRDRKM